MIGRTIDIVPRKLSYNPETRVGVFFGYEARIPTYSLFPDEPVSLIRAPEEDDFQYLPAGGVTLDTLLSSPPPFGANIYPGSEHLAVKVIVSPAVAAELFAKGFLTPGELECAYEKDGGVEMEGVSVEGRLLTLRIEEDPKYPIYAVSERHFSDHLSIL